MNDMNISRDDRYSPPVESIFSIEILVIIVCRETLLLL